MTIPVYFINGLLESGKTEFINFTIEEDFFKIDELTLIIVCEEGISEYEDEALKNGNAVLEFLEDEADFNVEKLTALSEKHKPERIIIEYNGMWNPKDIVLPPSWHLEEQITLIDATTFPVYYANMKSRIAEMARNSDVVVFNRCDDITELPSYRRSIRAVNQFGDIIFENAYGEIDDLGDEDLPYDLESDTISLTDDSYAVWYLDSMERPEKYQGKTIEFTGMVMHSEEYPEHWFIPGRIAMVCCEEDIAFLGYPSYLENGHKLQEQQWMNVRAKFDIKEWFEYEGEGPVLYIEKLEPASAPEKQVIDVR
ncbi:MAG: GTPase [Peptococcaceae bacterium]|nr:GTPase [Peptococcaceae bacterium]MBQ3508739.1 GTPase [Peptococcaceae bacterium]